MLNSASGYHLIALLGTLFVESLGMAAWAVFAKARLAQALSCALVVNLVVHTLFWYTQPLFLTVWPLGLYVAEGIVVLIEGALYARCLQRPGVTPWALSFGLNLASFLTGLWLWQI